MSSVSENVSELLPRVSPELALVDPDFARGLRLRERVLSRRRRPPFAVLRLAPSATDRYAPSGTGAATASRPAS
jgi:hypothetical protein